MKKLMVVNEETYRRFVCPTCGATLFTQNKEVTKNPFTLSVDAYCTHCGEKVYYEEGKEKDNE